MENIIIKNNKFVYKNIAPLKAKRKVFKPLLLILISLFFLYFIFNDILSSNLYKRTTIQIIFFVIISIFFLLSTIYFLRIIFTSKTKIKIDKNGISYLNEQILKNKTEMYKWSEIKWFYITENISRYNKEYFIIINVHQKEHQLYISDLNEYEEKIISVLKHYTRAKNITELDRVTSSVYNFK